MNACIACRQGKRGCDRLRPTCSTCSRAQRTCVYDEDIANQEVSLPSHPSMASRALVSNDLGLIAGSDPYQWASTRNAAVNATVATDVLLILGGIDKLPHIATNYFSGIHRCLPILSLRKSQLIIPTLSTDSPADVTTLVLCMHLLAQRPASFAEGMQTALYVKVKEVLSLLEATGYHTLQLVQSIILVTLYEVGHGLFLAATMSIGACARLARAIGLDRHTQPGAQIHGHDIHVEGQRRTWWAIVNIDRVINFCCGDTFMSTPDLTRSTPIPTDDDLWLKDAIPNAVPHVVSTPCSPTIGVFARECQVSHLLGAVIRHVYEPAADATFQTQEADQLEKTLMAFMPLLLEEHNFHLYGVALSLCCSTLIEHSPGQAPGIKRKLTELSTRMTQYMYEAWSDLESIDLSILSPFMIYCIYQCAVLQRKAGNEHEDEGLLRHAHWLKEILGVFGQRWMVARKYSEALISEDAKVVFFMKP